MKKWLLIAVIVVFPIIILGLINSSRSEDISNSIPSAAGTSGAYRVVLTDDIPGAAREFSFSFSVFESWKVEAVGDKLNIYDPAAEAEGNLEKSRIFVKFFEANDFQKPEIFNILSRQDQEINGRPSVSYVISKKDSAELTGEPSWRGGSHRSVDIRLRPENPSLFIVFAKNPDLPEAEFERFLKSIKFI